MPQVKRDEIDPAEFDAATMWFHHDCECPDCGDPAVVPEGYPENDDDLSWQEFMDIWERATRFKCFCGAVFSVERKGSEMVRRKVVNYN